MTDQRDPQLPAMQVGEGRYSVELLKTIDAALTVEPDDRPHSIRELLSLLSHDLVSVRNLFESLESVSPRALNPLNLL